MRIKKSGLRTGDLGREGKVLIVEIGRERRDWMKLEMGFEIYLQMLRGKPLSPSEWKDTGGTRYRFLS